MVCERLDLTSTGGYLSVGYVQNVTNGADLKARVLAGSLDCSLINPSLVPDILVLAVAANKAALSKSRDSMKTRNINTEVLHNLSPVNNVSTRKAIWSLRIINLLTGQVISPCMAFFTGLEKKICKWTFDSSRKKWKCFTWLLLKSLHVWSCGDWYKYPHLYLQSVTRQC